MPNLEKVSFELQIFNHRAHFIQEKIIIVGGVDNSGSEVGIIVCDFSLETNEIRVLQRFSLQKHHPDIMLINHTTHELENGDILIVGGGSNCFSFGTHFNSDCLKIKLSQLI